MVDRKEKPRKSQSPDQRARVVDWVDEKGRPTLSTGRTRATICTPQLTLAVALHVAIGSTIPVACEAAGLSYRTAEDWLGKGRKGIAPFDDFVQAMDEAKATFEVLALRGITVAGRSDWKALAWLLERRFGERYRPPSQRQELTGADGGPVAISQLSADELRKIIQEGGEA